MNLTLIVLDKVMLSVVSVAEMVLVSGVVEVIVAVICPLALVGNND